MKIINPESLNEYFKHQAVSMLPIKCVKLEKSRERVEKRHKYVADGASWLTQWRKWPRLNCVCAIKIEVNGQKIEWNCYILSRMLIAEDVLQHARMEWAVESMHWLLDVHFDEDGCRAEDKNVQKNMNMLHKSALNVIKRYQSDTGTKRPLSKIMFDCLLEASTIMRALGES